MKTQTQAEMYANGVRWVAEHRLKVGDSGELCIVRFTDNSFAVQLPDGQRHAVDEWRMRQLGLWLHEPIVRAAGSERGRGEAT